METVFKSLELGFILRSLVAGAYFVISYIFSGGGVDALVDASKGGNYAALLPAAVLAGVTVYTLHRSVVYPVLEWILNARSVQSFRKSKPLISRETLKVL